MDNQTDNGDRDRQWTIVRDGTEGGPEVEFLSVDQEWGSIDTAMLFDTQVDATRDAKTLCPPFMPGHAEPAPRG